MQCNNSSKKIGSGFNNWGFYGTTQQCPNYMVGFQVQICNKYVGATNMLMYCSRDKDDYKTANSWDGSQGPCNWGPVQYCPDKYAVCGFKYEYEPYNVKLGNSAINNVMVLCCPVK